MSLLQTTIKYIRFRASAYGKKGFGIHSPFVFKLVTQIIHDYTPFYCFSTIENQRRGLAKNNQTLHIKDYGSGSRSLKSPDKTIAQIAKYSLKPPKQAQLLFRLVNYLNPSTILELGTSLGITTSYLASVSKKTKVITIEGCPELAKTAQQTFSNLSIDNIEIMQGTIENQLPNALISLKTLDFVFFDANHQKGATLQYFEQCLPHTHNQTLFVFDDIHKNAEMEEAWEIIKQNKQVTVTIDLYCMGLVFFKSELTKEHYKIKF